MSPRLEEFLIVVMACAIYFLICMVLLRWVREDSGD